MKMFDLITEKERGGRHPYGKKIPLNTGVLPTTERREFSCVGKYTHTTVYQMCNYKSHKYTYS